MYISYKFFDLLQSSSSRVKMVNHYEVPVIFQDIEHQLKESLITFFVIILYKTFTKKYLRTTYICLLEAFATFPNHINHLHPNIEDIFLLLYLFPSLITYQYQLKDLILIWYFLKLLFMLIQVLKKPLRIKLIYFKTHIFKILTYIS